MKRANTAKPIKQTQQVKAPVAQARVRKSRQPRVQPAGRAGDVIVEHREYIQDLMGSVLFVATMIPINPGLPTTFPWLSALAQRFESYRFDYLRLIFETESPTTATGSVFMAVDYDASDPTPTTKTQVMSYRDAMRSPPWQDVQFTASGEDLRKRTSYYVRSGGTPQGTDIKLYDVGNWFPCTYGQANTSTVGELYVEYKVRLMTPQIGNVTYGTAIYGSFQGNSNAAPFGTPGALNNISVTSVATGTTASVTTFTFALPWQGYMSYAVTGVGVSEASLIVTAGSSAALLQDLANGTDTEIIFVLLLINS
jgi:hypothetical protein